MKKLLYKILIYLLIIFIPVVIVNYIFVNKDKRDDDDTNKFINMPENIEICNFGSSHGLYGFDYDDYIDKYVCFNFALSAQPLSYDYRILANYKDKIKEGAVVIVPISYFSLYGQYKNTEAVKSMNKRYYKILPDALIKDYDLLTEIYVNYLPSVDVNVSDLINVLIGKSTNNFNDIWNKTISKKEMYIDAKSVAYGSIIDGKIDADGNRIIYEDEIKALYSIKDICDDIDAQLILVTLPLSSEYHEEVAKICPNFYEQFLMLVETISNDLNVKYYDYSKEKRIINDDNNFMNSDHLNRMGAKKFTKLFMEEVILPIIKK